MMLEQAVRPWAYRSKFRLKISLKRNNPLCASCGLRPAVRQKGTGGPSATWPTGDIREMKEAAN